MAIFELAIKLGTLEKRLGKEPVSINISELEMASLLKALSKWNKSLYSKVAIELIEEAQKEGYQMMVDINRIKVPCPHCKGDVII